MPFTSNQMLAITANSAYKICAFMNSGGTACENSCTNDFILDIDGNKCQTDCDSGKVLLIPQQVCNLTCDTNFYYEKDGKCGLCKDFSEEAKPYKLINAEGCLSSFDENIMEYYNEDLNLLKCKTGYILEDNQCVPHCYSTCRSCSEYSENNNDQKCSSCKDGYILESGNFNMAPTTMIIPPTTTINPPSTVIIPPTTVIISSTTENIPTTAEIITPTTIIKEAPSTQVPKTEYLETCSNKKCLTCNEESDKEELCLSCDESIYKKVNYTNKFSKFVNCFKEEELKTKFYFDNKTEQYKPCYKLCKRCSGPGNASVHNCLECIDHYMLRPGVNPYNNCVVYSEHYYLSIYNEYKPLNNPKCPEEAKYTIKDDKNKTSCVFDCKIDPIYKLLYDGNCVKACPEGTNEVNSICIEIDRNRTYISENQLFFDSNDTIEDIELLTKLYAKEFNYTNNHISTYKDKKTTIILYKNPNIIKTSNLKVPDIDFGDCYKEVQKAFNITENLIIAIAEKKLKNNPSTFYLFFHPETGIKLDIGDICQNKSIKINENLDELLDEKSDKYELQKALTKQGINIFDINDPYYKDICYDFDNPKKRDIALKDRIKETYINVTLCDEGCVNTGIDLVNNIATCDCKFNDVTNNDLIHENAALEYLVGEIFDIISSSNILVLKCYKNLFKYFTKSIGGIMLLTIIALCIIFTVIFFSYDLTKMIRYIYTLTEKYTSFLANYSNVLKLFPPRKNIKNKSSKIEIANYSKDINDNKINLHKKKKQNTARFQSKR